MAINRCFSMPIAAISRLFTARADQCLLRVLSVWESEVMQTGAAPAIVKAFDANGGLGREVANLYSLGCYTAPRG